MRNPAALLAAAALALSACSGGEGPGATSPAGTGPEASASATTGAGSASTTPGAPAPSGEPLVAGVPPIVVLAPAAENAGDAPRFAWEPVESASGYSLAVLGPDGPVWGWQGEETEIYLGGLPFERPPGWAGPVLPEAACWSVIARGADGHVVAVSELLPVSPAAAPDFDCVPGAGLQAAG
jgi:hypothetical protein